MQRRDDHCDLAPEQWPSTIAGSRTTCSRKGTFYDAMHDLPFQVVRAQGIASRYRMLRAWRSLLEDSPEADRWIGKAGPEHFSEHLPRLREWVSEIGR
jgi:hypothetical protein